MTREAEDLLDRLLDTGVVPFRPTYVRRFYRDGGRLRQAPSPGKSFWYPERWIASTVSAVNPHPLPGEGQSWLAIRSRPISFRQALEVRGERILGSALLQACGATFPILIKILDPAEPIPMHFHARDEDVRRHPHHFPGQRFGKDEAYYFLPSPSGAIPYAHVGLHQGVTPEALARAVELGPHRLRELSPCFYQRAGEGFFVPAGVPHRPGTALALEVQQPSDVYVLLERTLGGRRLPPKQVHPGFRSLREALRYVDFQRASDPEILARYRLVPEPIAHSRSRGGEEAWIFPPRLVKFAGKRLVVRTRFQSQETGPYVVLVWRGRGRLLGRRLRPGSEMLITAEAAVQPHLYEADGPPLEVFKLFAPEPSAFQGNRP
ncbi:MAG: hypothetical protein QN131_10865 [Armatimonadota bacterium]|nr:hypothetical protein [Armatimonadota bacterium]MDR7550418.1 hypothetical protein [Armatimonadota bacterium]